jgi:hypothetical protein
MKHELKIHPQYYCRVEDGSKTFEVRENDRGFCPGDQVVLKEWDPEIVTFNNTGVGHFPDDEGPKGYTGKQLTFKVGYVLPIQDNRVVFSLLKT